TQEGLRKLNDMRGRYLIVYLNEVHINKKVQEINPDIRSQKDLAIFFEENFGDVIYNYSNIIIFEHRY
ncbi:MAG: hypothetical protein WAX66_04455, partial [Patescibacteria group bacterium]